MCIGNVVNVANTSKYTSTSVKISNEYTNLDTAEKTKYKRKNKSSKHFQNQLKQLSSSHSPPSKSPTSSSTLSPTSPPTTSPISSTSPTSPISSNKIINTPRIGLRLVDLVNLDIIDIGMKKTVIGPRKMTNFNINDLKNRQDPDSVPSKITNLHLINHPHILETITVFVFILENYSQTNELNTIILHAFYKLKKFRFWREFDNYYKVKEAYNKGELDNISLDESLIIKVLKENNYTLDDLYAWITCIKSKTLGSALKAMELPLSTVNPSSPLPNYRKWPTFLILFTLRRPCFNRLEAHDAIRLFQYSLPLVEPDLQFGLFIRTLRILHEWLVEYIPTLCKFFLRHSHANHKSSFHCNQILWLLCKFGTKWSEDDSLVLAESLRLTVDYMSDNNIHIDTKGYLAIAYITSLGPTDKALGIVDFIKRHEYECSREELIAREKWSKMLKLMQQPNEKDNINEVNEDNDNDDNNDENGYFKNENQNGESENGNNDFIVEFEKDIPATSPDSNTIGVFPYVHGIYGMELLMSQDSFELLRKFDNIPKEYRISMIWGMLLTKLRSLGDLTPEVTERLWERVESEKVNLSSYLIQRLAEGFQNSTRALEIVGRACSNYTGKVNYLMNEQSIESLLKVRQFKDLTFARLLLSSFSKRSVNLYNIILDGESKFDRKRVWITYETMRMEGFDPNTSTLYYICLAASCMPIKWGELYAAQRAVLEFKTWVRGARKDGTDINDPLKVYPTQQLFHRYITLVGRANYRKEIADILPWMERIKFQPNKLCLCALIKYSPNGRTLYNHGLKAGGEWPTQSELDRYNSFSSRFKVKNQDW